ncbi:MAG: hypothetical protein CMJ20_03495 [Phycisphaeraceae bacterium]|nr:hypothetical protein [Phycisphaeraceae bacterium]
MVRYEHWITRGFESFRRGTFGNAGQNLYVSRRGILQRIFLHDLNQDGYIEAIFCNCQDQLEAPDIYVYTDPLNSHDRIELPADGALSGAVADLNGDGYDDLVLGMEYNGASTELHAFIYYGSAEGFREQHCVHIPVPQCQSVAIGDFDGDGRPDLAFISKGKLRVFYQTELGFEPSAFTDLDISGDHLASADLDCDGYADLYIISDRLPPRVLWGGKGGLSVSRKSEYRIEGEVGSFSEQADETMEQERVGLTPLARTSCLGNEHHLFVAFSDHVYLVPIAADRSFGRRLKFFCPASVSVASGDFNGNGEQDLVFATREKAGKHERSWIYWGAPDGFSEDRRTELDTFCACDVTADDLNGSGCDDIIICQNQTPETYSVNSRIFCGCKEGVNLTPVELPTEGARLALVAKGDSQVHPHVIFINRWGRTGRNVIKPVIYFGGSDGFSVDRCQYLEGIGAATALPCDFNDDGRPDLVFANSAENAQYLDPGTYCYLQGDTGFSGEPSVVLPSKHAWGLAAADIDRDGCLELVIIPFIGEEVLIYRSSGDGFDTGNPQRIRLIENGKAYKSSYRGCLADLNNDGYLDLVLGQLGSDRCFVLWGGPDGAFSQKKLTRIAGHSVTASLAADFNEDGWVDLVIANHKIMGDHKGDSFVLMNGPDGFDPRPVTRLPTMGPHGMIPVQPGNQKDRGPEEYYISEPHELSGNACVQKIEWEADVPAKTWVKAQIRLADSENLLDSAVWQGRDGAGSWLDCGEEAHHIHHEGGWVQYRLALGAINSGSTPRIQEVKVTISKL